LKPYSGLTAITRKDGTYSLPDGISVKSVDYDDLCSAVKALQGQDALLITLNPQGISQQTKLICAAAEAKAPWVPPNDWSPNATSEALKKGLTMLRTSKRQTREMVEKLGLSLWISLTTGSWREW
jgi:hypothetical protein